MAIHIPLAVMGYAARKAYEAWSKNNRCCVCSGKSDGSLDACCGAKICCTCIKRSSRPILGGVELTCPACSTRLVKPA